MVIYIAEEIFIGRDNTEPVEVALEVFKAPNGLVRVEVMGVHPHKGKHGELKWEPFVMMSMNLDCQRLVDRDHDLRARCELAYGDAERMNG